VIGEYGMFVEHRRTFSACAEGPVRLWAISYPVLHHFLLAYPESVFSLMRQTVTRLLDALGSLAVAGEVSGSSARNAALNPSSSRPAAPSSLPSPTAKPQMRRRMPLLTHRKSRPRSRCGKSSHPKANYVAN
jgi:CRP-like cAMP-binding protein